MVKLIKLTNEIFDCQIFTNTIYKFGSLTDQIDYFNNEEYIFS